MISYKPSPVVLWDWTEMEGIRLKKLDFSWGFKLNMQTLKILMDPKPNFKSESFRQTKKQPKLLASPRIWQHGIQRYFDLHATEIGNIISF